MDKIEKLIKKPDEILDNGVYTAPYKLNKNSLSIQLPASLYKNLKLKTDEKLFFIVTNGVVQITGAKPIMTIPVLTEADEFGKDN